jgi:hypothetical protein
MAKKAGFKKRIDIDSEDESTSQIPEETPDSADASTKGPPKGKKGKKLSKKEKEEGIGREKRVEILKNFTKEVLKKYGPLVRSIVLFGSTARNEFRG